VTFSKTVKKGAFDIHYSIVDYGHGKEKRVSIKCPGLKQVLHDRSKHKSFRQMEAELLERYKKKFDIISN
jgi:hypothetical protein